MFREYLRDIEEIDEIKDELEQIKGEYKEFELDLHIAQFILDRQIGKNGRDLLDELERTYNAGYMKALEKVRNVCG